MNTSLLLRSFHSLGTGPEWRRGARLLSGVVLGNIALVLVITTLVYASQIVGGTAGNGDDSNSTTFAFRSDNADVQLTRSDGATPIDYGDVAAFYGTAYRIYDNGTDITSPNYTGPGGPKILTGCDLSGTNWVDYEVPAGMAAIDPVTGRFKFHKGDPLQETEVVGSITEDGWYVRSVWQEGNYAYVTDGQEPPSDEYPPEDMWFRVFDVSDPTNPYETDSVYIGPITHTTSTQLGGVYIEGDYAYIAAGYNGLNIINVANPFSISVTSVFTAPPDPLPTFLEKGVYVSGQYAYVADSDFGLRVIDISDKANPVQVGKVSTELYNGPLGIDMAGSYIYMANRHTGLQIVDVSQPTSPTLISTAPPPAGGNLRDVKVRGDYAYVACGSKDFVIYNVSDPGNPFLIESSVRDTDAYGRGIDVAGGYAYLADDWGTNFIIFDISDPTNPVQFDELSTSGHVYDVDVTGDYAYLASNRRGLKIIRLALPTEAPDGPVTVDFHYDGTPPDFGADPIPSSWVTSQTLDVSSIVTDIGSGLAVTSGEYHYSTDGGTNWSDWITATISGSDGVTTTQTMTAASVPFGQDSEAENLIQFRAGDMAGNTGTSPSYMVRIDTVAPASAIGNLSSGQAITSSSYVITGTASDATSGVSSVEVGIDNGDGYSWATATVTGTNTAIWSYTWTPASSGIYTVTSRASDIVGHLEEPGEGLTITVDLTTPEPPGNYLYLPIVLRNSHR